MKTTLCKAFKRVSLPIVIMFAAACTPVPQDLPNGQKSRLLTTGEIEMASAIFGTQINYRAVRVMAKTGTNSQVRDNNIFMKTSLYKDDYSKSNAPIAEKVFMHEMTHIWQNQQGVDLVDQAINLFFRLGGNYNAAYEYDEKDLARFSRLSIEQQGEIIEDYFNLTNTLNNKFVAIVNCPKIKTYEEALKPIFPAIQTPNLCR